MVLTFQLGFCDMEVFPLNGVKHTSRNSSQISSRDNYENDFCFSVFISFYFQDRLGFCFSFKMTRSKIRPIKLLNIKLN